jgi:MFS family permease
MGTLSSCESDPRPDRARFTVLAFACSLSLITYLDRICIMQVSEAIRDDLGFAPFHLPLWFPLFGSWQWEVSAKDQMGWVFSAFSLGYMLCEVPGGWLGDRWGARRVLIRIVIWWSVFTALTGMISSTPAWPIGALLLMILVRFLFGCGEAGAYPNLTRVVRTWFPLHERARAQGVIWMSARMGGAIAPGIIRALASWLGWQPAFWVLGAIGLIWAVLFYRVYQERPATPGSDGEAVLAETPAPPATGGHEWPAWGVLFRSATIWAIGVVAFTVCLGWYFFPTWQPEYFSEVYGIPYKDSWILTGLPFAFGAVGSLLGGVLSDRLIRRTGSRRWGRSVMGVVGFGLAGLCVFAAGLTSTWWQAVALLCLASLFNDLAIPVIWAVCADIGGRFVGTVAGLMNMVGAVGAILCPMLIPLLLDHLWPAPPPSAGLGAGCFVTAALPQTYGAADRWQYVFAALAATWFVGAVAWLFVNAAKPIFTDHRPVSTS